MICSISGITISSILFFLEIFNLRLKIFHFDPNEISQAVLERISVSL